MKVLYIITQADGGGAQNYTLALAQHFGGKIAAGNEASKLFTEAKQLGIPCIELRHLKRNISPLQDFLAAIELIKLIKEERPSLVHLNSSKAGFIGSVIKPFIPSKIIFTAHGFVFNEPLSPVRKKLYLWAEQLASKFRDYIIAVSDADRKSALEHNLVAKGKIETIHNGIGRINFLTREEARKNLDINLPQTTKVIGVVANAYPAKGLDVLEKASNLMTSDSVIIVTGNNPKSKMATNDGKFKYNEYSPHISRHLKAFDIFAIPSRKEGLPFALLEAMQAGLPIVATKVGGIPEALGDAGILVEPEDPAALAAALDKLAKDPLLAEDLSRRALDKSKFFTQEKMFQQTEAVYKKILL